MAEPIYDSIFRCGNQRPKEQRYSDPTDDKYPTSKPIVPPSPLPNLVRYKSNQSKDTCSQAHGISILHLEKFLGYPSTLYIASAVRCLQRLFWGWAVLGFPNSDSGQHTFRSRLSSQANIPEILDYHLFVEHALVVRRWILLLDTTSGFESRTGATDRF